MPFFGSHFFDLQIKAVFRIPISVPSNWVKTPLKFDQNRVKNGLRGRNESSEGSFSSMLYPGMLECPILVLKYPFPKISHDAPREQFDDQIVGFWPKLT